MSAAALKYLRVRSPALCSVVLRTADLHSWGLAHATFFGKNQHITIRPRKCPCGCGTHKHPRTLVRAVIAIQAIEPDLLTAYWPAATSQPVRCSAIGRTKTVPSLLVGLRCSPSGDPVGWVMLACAPQATAPQPSPKPLVPGGTPTS